MKKQIFVLLAVLASVQLFAQADTYTFVQFATSRYHSSDSVQINFVLSTNNIAKLPSISIIQTAGPVVKFTTAPTWTTGAVLGSSFWQGLAPGTYSFTATATSGSGTVGTQTATIQVVADPVIPVCPVIPPPRTVTSLQITINGQLFTIPINAGVKFGYSDGGTQ